jgi:hypothetical protein
MKRMFDEHVTARKYPNMVKEMSEFYQIFNP